MSAKLFRLIDAHMKGEQMNQRDLPKDIPLDSVVVLRYEKRSKCENKGKVPTEMELVLEQTQQGTSNEVSICTSAGNHVKEILLKFNLPDHRILKDRGEDFRYSETVRPSRSDEVLKLKNFKKDAILKLFKLTNQERFGILSRFMTNAEKSNEVSLSSSNEVGGSGVGGRSGFLNQSALYDLAPLHGQTFRKTYVEIGRHL
ncbi:hypothetical protein Tco_0540541 [Tanacetum coccineum]